MTLLGMLRGLFFRPACAQVKLTRQPAPSPGDVTMAHHLTMLANGVSL